ncbi:hypothetical protein C8R43DRAFT_844319, partial [Mycena crocata]
MLLWIKNALTPQEIRDRLMRKDSVFQKKLVAYLESAHQGEFTHGTLEDVRARVKTDLHPSPEEEDAQSGPTYQVPTQTLPSVPPPMCSEEHGDEYCEKCLALSEWWVKYEHEVDDLILRSNVHQCRESTGICKARFPRDLFENTHVDKDGHVNIRKKEAYVNTISRVVTYFSRSNTDVTSLLSGTSVKAVVSYVSDYVSKIGLKTYQAFASIHDVFAR